MPVKELKCCQEVLMVEELLYADLVFEGLVLMYVVVVVVVYKT